MMSSLRALAKSRGAHVERDELSFKIYPPAGKRWTDTGHVQLIHYLPGWLDRWKREQLEAAMKWLLKATLTDCSDDCGCRPE